MMGGAFKPGRLLELLEEARQFVDGESYSDLAEAIEEARERLQHPENWVAYPLKEASAADLPALQLITDVSATTLLGPGAWMGIAVNHDLTSKSVGRMRQVGHRVEVELFQPMTEQDVYKIFGNIGMMVTESQLRGDAHLLSKFEILEFSYSPAAASGEAAAMTDEELKAWHLRSEKLLAFAKTLDAGEDRDRVAFVAGGALGLAMRNRALEARIRELEAKR